MRFGILILLLLGYISASGKTADDENGYYCCLKKIEQEFGKLKERSDVRTDAVMYTGDDREKAGGFLWQRGSGKGWTTGERMLLEGVSRKEAVRFRELFEAVSSFVYVNMNYENSAVFMDDDAAVAYAYAYDPDAGLLMALRVKPEDAMEISIPARWTEIAVLDATKKDNAGKEYGGASEMQLRLLGLSRLWDGVKRNFVFFDKMKCNWDSAYVAAIPEILKAKNRDECYMVLQRFAATAGDGHTMVYGGDRRCVLPIATRAIGGKVYVDEVMSSDFSVRGVTRGAELVEINGVSPEEYARHNVVPYISSSTPQWTETNAYGSELLKGFRGDSVNLVFESGGKIIALNCVYGYERADKPKRKPLFTLRALPGNTAYLRIDNFMEGGFANAFDKIYPEILLYDALIIDVRDNNGGNSGNGDYVLRHLASDSIATARWESPVYIPAFASWGERPRYYKASGGKMAPADGVEIYDKPVAVLVNGGTFSAAEDFVSLFRCMKRGPVIGTSTGGSTGNGVRVELIPGHSYANICSKHDFMPDGTEFVGTGIVPDVEVTETYESYFAGDMDNAVRAALERIRGMR